MKAFRDSIEEDGIGFDAYKCACGEEILDMQQMKALAKKYRTLRDAKKITFSQWGNSLAVRIPKDFVTDLSLANGTSGLITKDKKGIRIVPT
ncbi:MAG: AbrB/MazE/SpoVT family DNA-binding domain-containing protein [Candidatus Woesearchaeota archaeon]|nr:AbrB/MazE/SpoVT family DNA-binding domain-containing protein [Candidatus Woesearchaeota archaeon]